LNTHTSAAMQSLLDDRDWLTAYRLPAYAPDLNPAEGVWSNVRHALCNFVARLPAPLDYLHGAVLRRLARIQAAPALLTGFIAETGLVLVALLTARPARRPGPGAGTGRRGRHAVAPTPPTTPHLLARTRAKAAHRGCAATPRGPHPAHPG